MHEPPIPDFVDTVVVTIGLSALEKPYIAKWVHRPEIYDGLSGLQIGDEVSSDTVGRVLCHPSGGLKNIPAHTRRAALLNQTDTPELCKKAGELAEKLSSTYHFVVIASLKSRNTHTETKEIHAVHKFTS